MATEFENRSVIVFTGVYGQVTARAHGCPHCGAGVESIEFSTQNARGDAGETQTISGAMAATLWDALQAQIR